MISSAMEEKIRIFVYIVLFPLLILSLYPLEKDNFPYSYSSPFFKHIDTKKGLLPGTVNTIIQDKAGYIWFGTSRGLCRYDGHSFTVYTASSGQHPLPSDKITALYSDSYDNLWIGTENGLCRMDTQRTELFHYHSSDQSQGVLKDNHITSISLNTSGHLVIGTKKGGLNIMQLPPGNDYRNFTPYFDSFIRFNNQHIGNFLQKKDKSIQFIAHNKVFNLLENRFTELYKSRNTNYVTSIAGQESILWAGTENGLCLVSPETSDHILKNCSITALYEDKMGVLWCGTASKGLYKIVHRKGVLVSVTNRRHSNSLLHSIASDSVSSLFMDSFGTLWIGHPSGIISYVEVYNSFKSSLSDKEPAVLEPPSPYLPDMITSALIDSDGNIWAGTRDGRIGRLTSDRRNEGTFETIYRNRYSVEHLVEDSTGKLWFTTKKGLLKCMNKSDLKVKLILRRDNFTTLCSDKTKGVFVTTGEGELIHINSTNGIISTVYSGNSPVTSTGTTSDGAVWLASGKNFSSYIFDSGKSEPLMGKLEHKISSIIPENRQNALISTSAGNLWQVTKGKNRYFIKKVLLPATSEIYTMKQMHTGEILLSCAAGLVKINRNNGIIKLLKQYKGIPLTSPLPTILEGNIKGDIIFKNSKFISFMSLQSLNINRIPPGRGSVKISFHKGNGKVSRILESSKTSLPARTDTFSITPVVTHYSCSSQNICNIKLQGIDRDYHSIKSGTTLTYTNIPPGTYTLEMYNSNCYGISDNRIDRFILEIDESVWQNSFFRYSASSTLVLLVSFLIVWRRVRINRKKSDLENRINSDAEKIGSLSLTLNNLVDELKSSAFKDILTGLPDFRNFKSTYQNLWDMSLNQKTPLCLIMIDIDNLSYINKISDYKTGDRIIVGIAEKITELVNIEKAFISRSGGDEFTLILPETTTASGYHLAEKISVSLYSIPVPPLVKLTVSTGCSAAVPHKFLSQDSLLETTCALLESAKSRGGNQVYSRETV